MKKCNYSGHKKRKCVKLNLAVDQSGNILHYNIVKGSRHDINYVKENKEKLANFVPKFIIGDSAYSKNELFEWFHSKNIVYISSKKRGEIGSIFSGIRSVIERVFGGLKQFLGILTNYSRKIKNYKACLSMAFSLLKLQV